MTKACRERLDQAKRNRSTHAGLVLRRYLRVAGSEKEANIEDKKGLLQDARRATNNAREVYMQAFERRMAWLSRLQVFPIEPAKRILATSGRLVVGLGNPSPLETGITLHHTFGTPILPGSAIKGLCAHYCDEVWGDADVQFKQDHELTETGPGGKSRPVPNIHHILFGTTEDAGRIIFHDAWITPESITNSDGTQGLLSDVMTPHHGDYYAGKAYTGGSRKGQRIPPTDFDDPTPIPFMSVVGSFSFALGFDGLKMAAEQAGPRTAEQQGVDADVLGWLELAWALLTHALADWGIGGKTSSGYGRMTTQEKPS